MPLPNPKVLDAIIQLYIDHRDKERKSVSYTDRFLTTASNLAKRAAGQPSDDKIIRFCIDVKKQFRPKDPEAAKDLNKSINFDEWINVVFYLGNKAKEAQDNKIALFENIGLVDKESLLCETLHGLRNYIVIKLKDADETKFNQLIKALHGRTELLRNKIANDRYIYTDVSDSVTEYQKLLIQLAFLEHVPSISTAIDNGLLSYLKQLDNKTANMPYCLQKNFFINVLYQTVFRKDTLVSFDEFEEKALNSDSAKDEKGSEDSSSINQNNSFFKSSPNISDKSDSENEEIEEKQAGKRKSRRKTTSSF